MPYADTVAGRENEGLAVGKGLAVGVSMEHKEIMLGIEVVLAVMRKDYCFDSYTLDQVEDEMKAYFNSCFPQSDDTEVK